MIYPGECAMKNVSLSMLALCALCISGLLGGMDKSLVIHCNDGLLELPARTRLWFNNTPGKRWVDTATLLKKARVLKYMDNDLRDDNEPTPVDISRESMMRLYQYLRLLDVDGDHAQVPRESLAAFNDQIIFGLARDADYLDEPRARKFLTPSLIEHITDNDNLRQSLLAQGSLDDLGHLIAAYQYRIRPYCKSLILQMVHDGLNLNSQEIDIEHNGFSKIFLDQSANNLGLALAMSITIARESENSFGDEIGTNRHECTVTALTDTFRGELVTGDESGRLVIGQLDTIDRFHRLAQIQGRSIKSIVSHPNHRSFGVIADSVAYLLTERAGDTQRVYIDTHEVRRLTKYRNTVTGLTFDHDGTHLIVSYKDGLIEELAVDSGAIVNSLLTATKQREISRLWGQAGPWLIISTGTKLKRKHMKTGKRKIIDYTEPIDKVVINEKQRLVAVLYGKERTKIDLISIPTWSWCVQFITNPRLVDIDMKHTKLAVLFSNGIPKVYPLESIIDCNKKVYQMNDPFELVTLYCALKKKNITLGNYPYLRNAVDQYPTYLKERILKRIKKQTRQTLLKKSLSSFLVHCKNILFDDV